MIIYNIKDIYNERTTMKTAAKLSKETKVYSKDNIKKWIDFGIENGYVNKVKKDELIKWADLILKHGVVNMESKPLITEKHKYNKK
jgi:hypothetical protein